MSIQIPKDQCVLRLYVYFHGMNNTARTNRNLQWKMGWRGKVE